MKKMDAPMHRAEGDGEPDAHTPNDAACCERSTPKRPEGRESAPLRDSPDCGGGTFDARIKRKNRRPVCRLLLQYRL